MGREGRELEGMEALVVVTCLVMLKKEVARRRSFILRRFRGLFRDRLEDVLELQLYL